MSAVSGFWKNKFEDTLVENNVLEKCVFDVDAENVVFGDDLEFVLPRMMFMLDNNNNFQTADYFSNRFCMSTFEMVLVKNVYVEDWICCKCNLGMDDFILVLLQLEFGIRNSGEKCMRACITGSSMLHDRIKDRRNSNDTEASSLDI